MYTFADDPEEALALYIGVPVVLVLGITLAVILFVRSRKKAWLLAMELPRTKRPASLKEKSGIISN